MLGPAYHLGSGPLWPPEMLLRVGRCAANGWANLLYANNIFHVHAAHERKPCLGHTWYLAADMQLFLFSPLAIIPLYRNGKRRACSGLKIWAVWFSALTIIPFALTLVYNLPPIPIE